MKESGLRFPDLVCFLLQLFVRALDLARRFHCRISGMQRGPPTREDDRQPIPKTPRSIAAAIKAKAKGLDRACYWSLRDRAKSTQSEAVTGTDPDGARNLGPDLRH